MVARADFSDKAQEMPGNGDFGQTFARIGNTLTKRAFRFLVGSAESLRIGVKGLAPFQQLDTQGRIVLTDNGHGQAETIEQLRPQLAFLGIHGAHQNETRRMAQALPLTLHNVFTTFGRVEDAIDEVIVEQIDFVNVKNAFVRARQDAGLETHRTVADRPLEIDRTDHHVLGCTQRKINKGG